MSGRLLAQALVMLKGKELRTIHVLCCDTGIVDLLSTKVKDLLPGKADSFIHHLEMKAAALMNYSDAKLQLDILLEMAKRLEIRGTHLSTSQEVEDLTTAVVHEADKLMILQHSQYQRYKDIHMVQDPLQVMVRYQLDQLLQQTSKELDKASPAKQREYLAKVQQFIDQLPDEKQHQIKERLGVEQLTKEVLQRIVLTSGSSILFGILVEVFGFAFYTSATSLFASLAGLLGITLSFGTYTALTSMIAILANPIFIFGLLGGGGILFYRSQSRKLRGRMLPILLLQITLPAMHNSEVEVSYTSLIDAWLTFYQRHKSLSADILDLERQCLGSKKEVAHCKQAIQKIKQNKYNSAAVQQRELARLERTLRRYQANERHLQAKIDARVKERTALESQIYGLAHI
ncbi:hypothetical protein J2W91_004684 [Paenibacillus amylolyticus]|uniref:Uncharacterized protein n=1 Tax=Paenibacillus amylolyticus TaxID=1451 RepID=A0AAP5H7H5_PAEAM|nr:hypothetical protein [Paenibacillus amylolyticus]MDR6726178.1 hypothetical protein [Paenibacillus amylolyticus]